MTIVVVSRTYDGRSIRRVFTEPEFRNTVLTALHDGYYDKSSLSHGAVASAPLAMLVQQAFCASVRVPGVTVSYTLLGEVVVGP